MKLTIRKNMFLNVVIALMICVYPIRRVMMFVTEQRPSTLAAIIIYGSLFLYFLNNGFRIRHIIKLFAPVIVVSTLLLITWIAFPERHSFYSNSLYNLWDLLFPTGCVYLMGISLLEKRIEDFYSVFKIAGYIIFIYCMIASIDVLADGVWKRESIYNAEIVTIESEYYLDWGYQLYLACVFFTGLYLREKRIRYPIMISIGLLWILLFGSRGALLSYIIFIAILYIYISAYKESKRGIIVGVFIVFVAILFNYGLVQEWSVRLTDLLNIQSRTLEKIMNGTAFDDSNRFSIYLMLISKFFESPIWGLGIYGDRYYMNYIIQGGSAYSHNIFLEMIVSFGVFGLLFMAGVIMALIMAFKKNKDKEKRIVLLVCIGSCLPLLWSLTFWSQPMFWILLAILFNRKTLQKNAV